MQQSKPNLTPGYETTFITRSELSDENLKALQDRLKQIIQSFEGEMILTEDWGKKKMAYPIKKEIRGQYTYIVYTGKGSIVSEIERNLRLHDHVLRFLTVNLGHEFEPAEFQKRRSELHAAAKRREDEREARREERNADRRGYGEDRNDYRRHDLDDGDDMGMSGLDSDDE